MTLVLAALGSFFIVQLGKLVWPTAFPHWLKPILSLIVSLGVSAYYYRHHPFDLVIYGVAAAGLAMVTHKVVRLCSVIGDRQIMEIFRQHR